MSDLRSTHVDTSIDPGNHGKIIAGMIVALVILMIGAVGWQAGWWHVAHPAVPDSRLPQASMPLNAPPKG
jgi:hypothetical protein